MNRTLVVPALLLAFAGGAASSVRADDAPPEHTGVKVGDRAPDFSLADQKGQQRSLGDFLKNGPVALVFYRSASW